MTLHCWKCHKDLTNIPFYKVALSFVFACEEHKDLEPEDGAHSLEKTDENTSNN